MNISVNHLFGVKPEVLGKEEAMHSMVSSGETRAALLALLSDDFASIEFKERVNPEQKVSLEYIKTVYNKFGAGTYLDLQEIDDLCVVIQWLENHATFSNILEDNSFEIKPKFSGFINRQVLFEEKYREILVFDEDGYPVLERGELVTYVKDELEKRKKLYEQGIISLSILGAEYNRCIGSKSNEDAVKANTMRQKFVNIFFPGVILEGDTAEIIPEEQFILDLYDDNSFKIVFSLSNINYIFSSKQASLKSSIIGYEKSPPQEEGNTYREKIIAYAKEFSSSEG